MPQEVLKLKQVRFTDEKEMKEISATKLELSDNALKVIEKRYLLSGGNNYSPCFYRFSGQSQAFPGHDFYHSLFLNFCHCLWRGYP